CFGVDSEPNGEDMGRFGVVFEFLGFGTVLEWFYSYLKLTGMRGKVERVLIYVT
ncbi:hypothetical protein A2U01_0048392, partial [Trifolium medium]|nr:hypothetical protein [Trifolium medium]